jgi:hypothetical protein
MVWSCRGALSMRQHHAAVKKSRNRLQVPALQSGRLRSETSGPTRCERKPLQGAQTGVVRQGVRIMCRRTAGRCREKSAAGAGLSSSKQVLRVNQLRTSKQYGPYRPNAYFFFAAVMRVAAPRN